METKKNKTNNIDENGISSFNINLQQNISCSIGQIQGNRISMEDMYLVDKIDDMSIFAVLDGHSGKFYVKKSYDFIPKITEIILKHNDVKTIKEKIKNLILIFDNSLFKSFSKNKKGGSTLLLLYLIRNKCIFINLGDSKVISFNKDKIHFESIQHRPNNIDESQRIRNANMLITNNNGILRINDALSVSRSIGDFSYKLNNSEYDGINSAVSCIPDLTFKKICDKKKRYFVLATDGLWDYLSNDKIIEIVKKYKCKNEIIKKLIKTAVKNGSNDNITIIFLEYN